MPKNNLLNANVAISQLVINYTKMLDMEPSSLKVAIECKEIEISLAAIRKWIDGKVYSIKLKNAMTLADVFYLVGEKRKEFLTTVTGMEFDLQNTVKTVLVIYEDGEPDNAVSRELVKNFGDLGYNTKRCYFSSKNIFEEIASSNFVICLISSVTVCKMHQNTNWLRHLSAFIENRSISLVLSVDLEAKELTCVTQWASPITLLSWKQKEANTMKPLLDELMKKEVSIPHPIQVPPTANTALDSSKISTKRKESIEKLLQYFKVAHNPSPLVLLSQFDTTPIRALFIDIAKNQYPHIYDIVLPQYIDDASFYNSLGRQFNLFDISSAGQFERELNEKLRHVNQAHFCLMSRFEKIGHDGVSRQFAGILRCLNEKIGSHLHIILLGGQKLQNLTLPSDISSMLNQAWIEYWPEWTSEELNLIYRDTPELLVAQELMLISGGHPKLLEYCLRWYKSELINSTHLSNLLFIQEFFLSLPINNNEKEMLMKLLDKKVLKPVPLSPIWMRSNPLLKKLYWENLITQREEGLCWRCEAIQLAGKQALENIGL